MILIIHHVQKNGHIHKVKKVFKTHLSTYFLYFYFIVHFPKLIVHSKIIVILLELFISKELLKEKEL
jgi:hypothetical protein